MDKEMILALLSLIVAIGCRACSELALHGKLRWSDPKKPYGFWGEESWRRKYSKKAPFDAPDNWYYTFFNIGVKERFPGSATFLVFLTDGYHLMQFCYHIFLALAFALVTDISYFLWLWPLVVLAHAIPYRLLSKKI